MLAALFRTLFRRPAGNEVQPPVADAKQAMDDGKQFSAAGNHAQAALAFERALTFDPRNAEAHFRLGLAQRDLRQLGRAAASYRRAVELRPGYIEAHNNLGSVLQMQNDTGAALEAYRRAVALRPDFAQPYLNLGRLYASMGDRENAAATFQQAVARGIDIEVFRHLLNALQGATTAHAPDDYTRSLFDNFAGDFDRRLVDELGYRIPETLAARIRTLMPQGGLRVLDLGCGTGLCGVQLAGHCSRLTGVDLSTAMLEKARARKLYTELADSNIAAWLEQSPAAAFDLVLAADVLVYFGELEPLFKAIAQTLDTSGLFGFSTELTTAGPFVLQASGRYAHAVDYVSALCERCGMTEVEALPHHIRGDVNGYLFILRKI